MQTNKQTKTSNYIIDCVYIYIYIYIYLFLYLYIFTYIFVGGTTRVEVSPGSPWTRQESRPLHLSNFVSPVGR